MTTHIALFRGINVGRAKRVAMAELREVLAGLGFTNVRTLLNSGNAVFDSRTKLTAASATAIRDAVAERTGVTSDVTVLTAADLAAIVAENPLKEVVSDPSRYLIAFPATPKELARVGELTDRDRGAERFAIGSRAAYLWCAEGILESGLLKDFSRLMGTAVTTRNWATVLKLHTMSSGGE